MIRSLILLLLLGICQLSYSQDVKAVLVQLSSEQNRVNYFLKKGDVKDANEVARQAKKINKAAVMDFSDHFVYCPVYYYIDTNRELIKHKHFDGTLLDAKGLPVNNAVIGRDDSDYIIVYYSYPENDKSVSPDHKGLVVLNDRMQQIYFMFRNKDFDLSKDPMMTTKYYYGSEKYDMEYKPFASRLNEKIGTVIDKIGKYRE